MLQASPERLHMEFPQAPPDRTSQFRHGEFDYLPGTANATGGSASKTSQAPDINLPPTINRDTSDDILMDAEVPGTPQRKV